MKTKEKEFDAVKMMRDIRDRLSERWSKNPELEMKDLEEIRKKYNIKVEKKDNQVLVTWFQKILFFPNFMCPTRNVGGLISGII